MKFKKIFSCVKNSNNNQYNFSLKIKQLKKVYPGMTPEELMNMNLPKSKVNFKIKPKQKK